jgi:hypothetical protein
MMLLSVRHSVYRRRLHYDPERRCVLGICGAAIEAVSVNCDDGAFVLPAAAVGAVSGVLELEVKASFSGRVLDPAIEIRAADFYDIQYLERGVRGTRFLNVTRLLRDRGQGERISLRGHGVTGRLSAASLHVCRETVAAGDRVLVIAPHPDDAEIAAFCLYSDTSATVVTLTAGDASDRYRNAAQPWMSLSRSNVARMRVWDSLTIPQLGRVSPERAINLCFPDGRLRDMYLRPGSDHWGEAGDAVDYPALRRMNRAPLPCDGWSSNWRSLVRDLSRLIADAEPTIVVAPHPKLDPHPDHLFATVAVSEALQAVGATSARMFLYTVHNRRSELWPFGPAGSGVALLPILPDDGPCGSGFYSHALSIEGQRQKLVALEAMHDARDLQWPTPTTAAYRQAVARIAGELRALVHGMGLDPTSYLRRAVRPDELFFVTSCQRALKMAQQAIEREESRRAAA